jgi:hypothetical protein
VCINIWNNSLNRSELVEHLLLAHAKGGFVFQSAESETTRTFLKAILDGKAIPAECTIKHRPSPAAAVPPEPTLQTLAPEHISLFIGALSCAEPLWFHPSVAGSAQPGMGSECARAGGEVQVASSDGATAGSGSASAAAGAATAKGESQQAPTAEGRRRLRSSSMRSTAAAAAAASSPEPKRHKVSAPASPAKWIQSAEPRPLDATSLRLVRFVSIEQPGMPSVVIRNNCSHSDAVDRVSTLAAAATAALAGPSDVFGS